jgi:phage FluMu gp28-like protein
MNLDQINEYMEEQDYDKRQRNYVNLLCNTFNMKNAKGELFPYRPEKYQIDYHAHCMLAMKDYPHRIWRKARGVGATATTMMDALMVSHRFRKQTIPVASITGEQASVPIDWSIELADNTQIDGFFNRRQDVTTRCVLDNGSTIFVVPGQKPDSLRSYRSVFVVYDEFAFHEYPRKIKIAGDRCVSEGGQLNILSTVNGTENEFWRLLENAEDFGYKEFSVPMFDPEKFDIKKPIPYQIEQGWIKPIAPWMNIDMLERDRKSDPIAFMQETMCQPEDGAVSFMSSALLYRASREPYMIEQDAREGFGIYVCGIDFATEKDMSAFEIFEKVPQGWIHRKRVAVQKHDTPQQVQLLKSLHRAFNFKYVTIDMTGPGTGFYHYAKEQLQTEVIGINFSTRHIIEPDNQYLYRKADKNVRKDGKISIPIKRAMATHMKKEADEGRLLFLNYPEYIKDLHSVPYDSLDAKRNKNHHGDEFWGSALALWGYQMHENRISIPPVSLRY